MKNWKTSLVGIGVFVSTVAAIFHLITMEQAAALGGALGGLGLVLAGDAKKTE